MINELKSANSAKIGKIFKEARNDIGISKRDIADSLVMSLKYIEAIESGNYAVFPSEGFARAYFIKYQDFLSINCDFPSIYNEDNRKDEIIKKSITKFNTSLIPLLIKAGITLLILFVLLMVYKSIFINKSSDKEIINIIDNAMNAELIAADIKNNLKEIDELEINNQEDLGDISIENEKINIENNLTLNFLNECWIEIYYENELVANQLFQTGDTYMLDIQKPFKVVVGNADNVEGTYNGVSIDFITNANRLRVNTIIFNDE
ncbi:MAG: helix-turn-helix domain-containing protein [Gammaproteobacteria bacterium]